MKKIEAYIRPFRLEAVKFALLEIAVHGMTVSEVRGFGRQNGRSEIYRGTEIDFLPKIKIEIICDDLLVATTVKTLMDAAVTGRIGDGKIIVSNVERAFRIRTGEEDSEAL